jgi:hypothetical protein
MLAALVLKDVPLPTGAVMTTFAEVPAPVNPPTAAVIAALIAVATAAAVASPDILVYVAISAPSTTI